MLNGVLVTAVTPVLVTRRVHLGEDWELYDLREHRYRQDYRVIDAALGVIERGWFDPREASETQPWLPDGPIPLHVEWRAPGIPMRRPWSDRHQRGDVSLSGERDTELSH